MRRKDENEYLTGTDLGGISKLLSVSVNYLSICLEKLRRKVMNNTGQDIRILQLNVSSGVEIYYCRPAVLNSTVTA
jgi:hypothetical protein